jgi:hypothetical protein
MKYQDKEEYKTTILYFEDENNEYIVTHNEEGWIGEEWDVKTLDHDEVSDELRKQLIDLAKEIL